MNNYSVSISARRKEDSQVSLALFLRVHFHVVPLDKIDSVFGFNDPCRLYGGCKYIGPELDDRDLAWMYANNIGYRIPLSNMIVGRSDYESAKSFLEKHHRKDNSVIVVKDSLARWIRKDFPLYHIECSVIRSTDTVEKLNKALDIYDTVVPLPEAFNADYELLESLPQTTKDRVRLFLNVGCALHCPQRICYRSFSRMNRGEPGAKFECSQKSNSYVFKEGMTNFPMEEYQKIGYTKFKMLRAKPYLNSTAF
ncbi:MAG: hypothetical protein HYX37_18385 [Rhizobiales bacterium]|nr:hypothetical protein [Hyphomicrobiales bacterium]